MKPCGGNPFFEDILDGIRKKQKEFQEYGVEVILRYSNFEDCEDQIKKINELLDEDIKGLAITPINDPKIAECLRKLHDLSIPVVTVNTDIENSKRICYVGSNYYKCGRTAGNLIGLLTGGKAKVGIVTGSNKVLCHTERVAGFKEMVSENYPDIEIVAIAENHDDDIESYEVTKEMIRKNPDLNALFLAAAGVSGACKAVESMNLQKKLSIVCFDVTPSTESLIKQGIISAIIEQQPVVQGEMPLDILFNVVGLGLTEHQEFNYTNINIKVKENL